MNANLNSQTAWAVMPELSPRELECLAWVSQGKSSTDIGAILGLSARTVDSYLEKAASKLGVRTRIEAVAVGVRRGLIEID
jgi:LuxR family quorum-sensing system transcriptional regulator CciR